MIENFKDYQNWTWRTAKYPRETASAPHGPLMYVALGLADEAREWSDEVTSGAEPHVVQDELGDIAWFVARVLEETGFEYSELINEFPGYNKAGISRSSAMFAGQVSKVYRDGLSEARLTKLREATAQVIHSFNDALSIANLCGKTTLTVLDVISANVEKLESRLERNVISGDGGSR